MMRSRTPRANASIGASAKAELVTDLVSDSRFKGIYGGLNLDRTVVAVSREWNEAFYGKPVTAPDILVRMSARTKAPDKLLTDNSRAAGKR